MYKQSIIPKPVSEFDLRLLRVFVAVVEHSGFSAAATALGITRSTVSVHMSNLETRLGLKLCNRGRSGFSLTADGQSVYHAVVELFSSFDDFSLLVQSLGKELGGELVILCADQLDQKKQRKLGQVIAQLQEQAPKLQLVLDGDTISNIEQSLLNDKAHIGIYPRYKDIDGLNYQQIFSESIYLCCASNHPFFNLTDSQIDQAELAQANAIHPGIDIDQTGREQLGRLNLSAKSYQFDTRKAMVLSGKFIGYLPQSFIQQELNSGEMRIIKPSVCHYEFCLSMVNKRAAREIQKVELAKSVISSVFQDDQTKK